MAVEIPQPEAHRPRRKNSEPTAFLQHPVKHRVRLTPPMDFTDLFVYGQVLLCAPWKPRLPTVGTACSVGRHLQQCYAFTNSADTSPAKVQGVGLRQFALASGVHVWCFRSLRLLSSVEQWNAFFLDDM